VVRGQDRRQKARDYVDAVSNLHWENNTLSGEVQGTQRRHPYVVVSSFMTWATTCG
jgi:uncharacterized Zn finger protein